MGRVVSSLRDCSSRRGAGEERGVREELAGMIPVKHGNSLIYKTDTPGVIEVIAEPVVRNGFH